MNSRTIQDRLAYIRKRMEEEHISMYMLNSSDFHLSEYPCEYFRTIEYLSGFTGSEAVMVITEHNAHLWTDGRYEITAHEELAGTDIIPHIYGDREDPLNSLTLYFAASCEAIMQEILVEATENGGIETRNEPKYVIGFDGRTFACSAVDELVDVLGFAYDSLTVGLDPQVDFVSGIWTDRPPLPQEKVHILEEDVAGDPAADKVADVRDKILDEFGPDAGLVITSLDDIAWLLNLRGTDQPYSNTFMAYAYMNATDLVLFIDEHKISGMIREYLENFGVSIQPYDQFYTYMESVPEMTVIIDIDRQNAAIAVTAGMKNRDVNIVPRRDLVEEVKAVKSDSELANTIRIHEKDAVAMIRFIKWVKENVGKVNMTELSAARYLELLRKEQGADGLSFETISAAGEHSAVIHYTPTEASDLEVTEEGFLLVDSGGQYPGGTTDITRTIVLGELTAEMKKHYTLVLASMLELGNFRFKYGINDTQLDVIARKPLWQHGLDFNHGTGHGVGYMLDVHEGPQAIAWKKRSEPVVIKEGMITTDEPGLYFEGEYGIRLENEILARRDAQWMYFDYITYVPFDREAIDLDYLTAEQREMLNRYHAMVYEKMGPKLDESEREWLREETKEI